MAEPGRWHAVLASERLESLISDPRFHRLLTLAHIANSIRFAQAAAYPDKTDDSPAASRQRAGSFFYLTGLLSEALKFADRLGQYFRELPSFALLLEVINDPATKQLRQTYLDAARNEAVFHNDDTVVGDTLPTFRLDEYIFASGVGEHGPSLYFDLADTIYLVYATGQAGSPDDFRTRFRTRLDDVVTLSQRFVLAAEALLGEELGRLDVAIERDPP